jgi:hypothetical protein
MKEFNTFSIKTPIIECSPSLSENAASIEPVAVINHAAKRCCGKHATIVKITTTAKGLHLSGKPTVVVTQILNLVKQLESGICVT